MKSIKLVRNVILTLAYIACSFYFAILIYEDNGGISRSLIFLLLLFFMCCRTVRDIWKD